jgi:hypothetical protein
LLQNAAAADTMLSSAAMAVVVDAADAADAAGAAHATAVADKNSGVPISMRSSNFVIPVIVKFGIANFCRIRNW